MYVNTNFHGYRGITWLQIQTYQFEDWDRAPALKIALRGISQLGSILHRFLRLKLHKSEKFHAGIIFCTIDVTSDLTTRGANAENRSKELEKKELVYSMQGI